MTNIKGELFIITVLCSIFIGLMYLVDSYRYPKLLKIDTPVTSIQPARDTILVNLTVNTGTEKEHGYCYPVTYSGLDIDVAYKTKCCAISSDLIKDHGLKMLRYIYIKCDYPFLSGYYLIIDKGPRNNNTVEIIYQKSNNFKMNFYLKNQTIIWNRMK